MIHLYSALSHIFTDSKVLHTSHCTMMTDLRLLVVIPCLFLINLQYPALGFGSGPPETACSTFIPSGHIVSAQTTTAPYTIVLSTYVYSAGETVTVTIASSGTVNFKGFLIKARRHIATGNTDPVGTFVVISGTKSLCDGKALSHADSSDKSTIELTWTAPSTLVGNLTFQATIVQEQRIFWTEVVSDTLQDPTDVDQLPPMTVRPNDDVFIDLNTCGSTKGCFRKPSGCTGDDCNVAATWMPSTTSKSILIELIGNQENNEGWIGIGFSTDDKMGDDDVYVCLINDGFIDVQHTYNDGRSNSEKNSGLLINDQISSVDGILKCSFERTINVTSRRKKRATDTAVPFDQQYYLLLGYGPTTLASIAPVVLQHQVTPLVSTDKVDISTDLIEVKSTSIFFQVHGILMTLAWMCMISISLIIARFYKPAWPRKKLNGKDLWFPIHVSLNTLSVVLTIVSFVIIFVKIEGYSEISGYQEAHPPIGIIVTFLAIINPLMAIFRPEPDAPMRFIFNICHWAVGSLAHLGAAVNIGLGLNLSQASNFVQDWAIYVFYAFVALHVVTWIILELHRCCMKKKSDKANEVDEKSPEDNYLGIRFTYFILAVYVLLNVGMSVALVVGMTLEK